MELTAQATERFGQLYAALLAELNWSLLEAHYCEGDSSGFFGAEAIDALADASLKFASDLLECLPRGGRSLYVGAGVAELAMILAESLLLEREICAVRLADAETEELNRALAVVEQGAGEGVRLPRLSTELLVDLVLEPSDHLWFVSVATDPQAFPALHALAYNRHRPPRRAIEADREAALGLMEDAMAHLDPRAQVRTSEDERELVDAAAEHLGWALRWEDTGRLSPIVGDVVRTGRLRPLH